MEGTCPDVEAPSDQQLSGLFYIIEGKKNPFVDLAVWGPRQIRMARRLIMSGMVPTGYGTFRRAELKGPPDYQTWVACMMVFRSAVVMLGVIGVTAIENYVKEVGGLAADYGTSVW